MTSQRGDDSRRIVRRALRHARGKRLGKEVLLLVSDYSTYGVDETVVYVKLPQGPECLFDVETAH